MVEHLDRGLSGVDAMMWRTGRAEPAMRWIITAVIGLQRAPGWDDTRARFSALAAAVPALRARPVPGLFGLALPRLITELDFDIDRHLRRTELDQPTWNDVLAQARRMSLAPLDDTRPLWRATLTEGLPDGRAALTMTLDHTIADGRALVAMAAHLFDAAPGGPAPSAAMTVIGPDETQRPAHPAAAAEPIASRSDGRTPASRLRAGRSDAADSVRGLFGIAAESGGMAVSLARHPRRSLSRWRAELESLDRIGPSRARCSHR